MSGRGVQVIWGERMSALDMCKLQYLIHTYMCPIKSGSSLLCALDSVRKFVWPQHWLCCLLNCWSTCDKVHATSSVMHAWHSLERICVHVGCVAKEWWQCKGGAGQSDQIIGLSYQRCIRLQKSLPLLNQHGHMVWLSLLVCLCCHSKPTDVCPCSCLVLSVF